MKVFVATFAWCCLLLGAGPAGATEPAPLSIVVHGDGAQATKLPVYDPSAPLAVSVTSPGNPPLQALRVVAAGPSGQTIRLPLSRAADGSFRGQLTLADQGIWNVRLITQSGNVQTQTLPVELDVEAPPPSNAWQIGLAVGAGIFCVFGIGGFWLLRRGSGGRGLALRPAA